jgi:hypothetical protein
VRRIFAVAIALLLALHPLPVRAGSAWGSPDYGDPPGWCTRFSDMWTAKVVTNDPLVGTNPERDTFYGFHPNPGYDDWYGFFYGDFRGAPGDASGWVKLLHEDYPQHYSWNFASNGWAVHGHAKEYIAYYNWTFGGQCGLGAYGRSSAPPYMADQFGYPVVDIYVDALPPFAPQPYVAAITPTSIAFTWDPVADRGDGAGRDYFMSGVDHYVSWLTSGPGPQRLQLATTAGPRIVSLSGMSAQQTACLHVVAFDRVNNASADEPVCAAPLVTPPMPVWPAPAVDVMANPTSPGLVGLDTWLWLSPAPEVISLDETSRGVRYVVTATPAGAAWDFGDGSAQEFVGKTGFGAAYPLQSSVTHTYEADRDTGYTIRATLSYEVTWTAIVGGRVFGPYPLGSRDLPARPLVYPVQQAQPVLLAT